MEAIACPLCLFVCPVNIFVTLFVLLNRLTKFGRWLDCDVMCEHLLGSGGHKLELLVGVCQVRQQVLSCGIHNLLDITTLINLRLKTFSPGLKNRKIHRNSMSFIPDHYETVN